MAETLAHVRYPTTKKVERAFYPTDMLESSDRDAILAMEQRRTRLELRAIELAKSAIYRPRIRSRSTLATRRTHTSTYSESGYTGIRRLLRTEIPEARERCSSAGIVCHSNLRPPPTTAQTPRLVVSPPSIPPPLSSSSPKSPTITPPLVSNYIPEDPLELADLTPIRGRKTCQTPTIPPNIRLAANVGGRELTLLPVSRIQARSTVQTEHGALSTIYLNALIRGK
ncbi:hypothetical protein GMRT_11690 [Giardia muris]|uniref:Uncharacterized protein n=1 Tax=Giardia muris TaxID=5742 RepID=A0A4Z1SXG9_GIAMU|nr:hypothetical protein GMRT_11690 [Giardia muris]|eukprot:TNJ29515.1 hypothetical protein GMRT_11690 [Giardia muris]